MSLVLNPSNVLSGQAGQGSTQVISYIFESILFGDTPPSAAPIGQVFIFDQASPTATYKDTDGSTDVTGATKGVVLKYINGVWVKQRLNLNEVTGTITQDSLHTLLKLVLQAGTGINLTQDDANDTTTVALTTAISNLINSAVQPADLHRASAFYSQMNLSAPEDSSTGVFIFRAGTTDLDGVNQALTDANVTSCDKLVIHESQPTTGVEVDDFFGRNLKDMSLDFDQIRANGGTFVFQTGALENGVLKHPNPNSNYTFTVTNTGNTKTGDVYTFTGSLTKTGNPWAPNVFYHISDVIVATQRVEAVQLENVELIFNKKFTTADLDHVLGVEDDGTLGYLEKKRGSQLTLTTAWQDLLTALEPDDVVSLTAFTDVANGAAQGMTLRFGDIRTDGLSFPIPVRVRRTTDKKLQAMKLAGITDTCKIRASRLVG